MFKQIKSFFSKPSAFNKIQNYISSQSDEQDFNISVNQTWKNDPYLYLQNNLYSTINFLSNYISTLDYNLTDEKGNVLESSKYQNIVDFIEKGGLRQSTYQQFIKDISMEFLFNRSFYILIDLEDSDNPKREVLKLHEILVQNLNYTNYKMIKSLSYNIGTGNIETFDLFEDEATGIILYKSRLNDNRFLFASELVFEDILSNSTQILYSKNILNNIFSYVCLDFKITNANISVVNKKEGSVILLSPKAESILSDNTNKTIHQEINSKVKDIGRNGQNTVIMTQTPYDAQEVRLNNDKFEGQFVDLDKENKKNIYNFFKIPPELGLEQGKYSNNIGSNIMFIENCIKPNMDFIFSKITLLIKFVFLLKDSNINIIGNLKNSSLQQQYETDNVIKLKEFMTINEIRTELGMQPLAKGGDELYKASFQAPITKINEN